MKTLKKLHYEDNIIVNVSSDAFDCLPNLIDLYIEDCGTFPLQAGLFSQIPSLEKLRMNGESLTFHQMHWIAQLRMNDHLFGIPISEFSKILGDT